MVNVCVHIGLTRHTLREISTCHTDVWPISPVHVLDARTLSGDSGNAAALLAGLLDSAMDAIVTIDEQQRIVLYNRAAERIFGWPREEMLRQPLEKLIPGRFRPTHAQHVEVFGNTGVTSRRMGGSAGGLRAALHRGGVPDGRVDFAAGNAAGQAVHGHPARHHRAAAGGSSARRACRPGCPDCWTRRWTRSSRWTSSSASCCTTAPRRGSSAGPANR